MDADADQPDVAEVNDADLEAEADEEVSQQEENVQPPVPDFNLSLTNDSSLGLIFDGKKLSRLYGYSLTHRESSLGPYFLACLN